jgi:drug/metabolite transporter (DMT)-like permease
MSRGIRWTGVAGLALVVAGMILVGPAPSVGTALAVVGLTLLGSLAFVVNARARRTRGWTRVWNPGAARREYKAEQARQGRDGEAAPIEGDKPEP